jgi:hypothetical protein
MAETETSRALHNGSLTSKAIGMGPVGPPLAREAAPAPAPMVPHEYALQFLISIIKNSQQGSPSQ